MLKEVLQAEEKCNRWKLKSRGRIRVPEMANVWVNILLSFFLFNFLENS